VSYIIKLLITAWLLGIAWVDLRTQRIPNWLTLPIMFGVGGYRLLQALYPALALAVESLGWSLPGAHLFPPLTAPGLPWVAWAIFFVFWFLHVMGGGDAKLLMGLIVIYPTLDFVLALALLILLIGVPWLLVSRLATHSGSSWRALYVRLLTLRIFPTAEELATRGKPTAWLFCLPGVIYTWFLS
jgi:Flp pilus assembly protein protease CpaA